MPAQDTFHQNLQSCRIFSQSLSCSVLILLVITYKTSYSTVQCHNENYTQYNAAPANPNAAATNFGAYVTMDALAALLDEAVAIVALVEEDVNRLHSISYLSLQAHMTLTKSWS